MFWKYTSFPHKLSFWLEIHAFKLKITSVHPRKEIIYGQVHVTVSSQSEYQAFCEGGTKAGVALPGFTGQCRGFAKSWPAQDATPAVSRDAGHSGACSAIEHSSSQALISSWKPLVLNGTQEGSQGKVTWPQRRAVFIQGPLSEPCWCLKCWDIFSFCLLCRNHSCFDWCKMLPFLLPLFFGNSLVKGSVFLPQVAIRSSYAPGCEAMRLPSFSLSTSVRDIHCNSTVLELKHFKHFLFCFEPMSIKWILLKTINSPIHFKYRNFFLFLPHVLLLPQ